MPLPPAPQPGSPTFPQDADTFLSALPGFEADMNALEEHVEEKTLEVDTLVADAMAAGLANAAANATTATTQAGIATGAAGTATTQANRAENEANRAEEAAADAEAAAGVIPPVSGNAGKVLKVNPTGTGTLWENADVRLVVEYLTSGTSWTAPAALVGGRVKYRMTGGGGGGGRSTNSNRAMNGGDAGYSEGYAIVTAGNPYAYTIGSGGAAGAAANTVGSDGGSTTMFGATCGGGKGGAVLGATTWADVGGTATGGSINLPGGRLAFIGATLTGGSISSGEAPLGRRGGNSTIGNVDSTGFGVGGRDGLSGTPAQAGMPGIIILEYLVRV